jgi:hypothetical protein
MTMGTADAIYRLGHSSDRFLKALWDGYFLTGHRIELRHYRAALALVLSRQVQLQSAVDTAKQYL